MMKQTFTVTGMHCASCGILIDDSLEDLPEVTRSKTDFRKGLTVVEYDELATTPQDIIAAIAREGYQADESPGG